MVLDEDALEAMIRRQKAAEEKASDGETIKSDETEEYEVYERVDADTQGTLDMPEPEEVLDETPVEAEASGGVRPEVGQLAPESPAPEILRTHAPEPQPEPAPVAPSGSSRLAIVQATFNAELTDRMADLALEAAAQAGASVSHHVKVPGVYDIPLIAQRMAKQDDVDAVVVLGAVVKGDTTHDELITNATARTLQDISCRLEVPIGLGIIGPGMTWRQGEDRVGNAAHAVSAALAQLALLRRA